MSDLFEEYLQSVESLKQIVPSLKAKHEQVEAEAKQSGAKLAQQIQATQRSVQKADRHAEQASIQAEKYLAKIGEEGLLADTGARTGGPPVTEASVLTTQERALDSALAALRRAVDDEEQRRRPVPAPPAIRQGIPAWAIMVGVGSLVALVIIIAILVL